MLLIRRVLPKILSPVIQSAAIAPIPLAAAARIEDQAALGQFVQLRSNEIVALELVVELSRDPSQTGQLQKPVSQFSLL
jgi:hypothetical protein